MLPLLELVFLLQRKSYSLTTHLEHVVYLLYAMILEATAGHNSYARHR